MTGVSTRLALTRSLLAGRGLRIADVGHSVGSTINIGAGRTTPHRYRKILRRPRRPGYYPQAVFDLFLASAEWEITDKRGYKLRWTDDARRIAKESARLIGTQIQTVDAPRYGNRIRLGLCGGISLTVWPDEEDEYLGWSLQWRGRHISLGDSE